MCSIDKEQPDPVGVEYLGKEDSECYPMNYKKKGLCYIFNHKNFEGHRWYLNPRIGTDNDAQQLTNVFEKLGFVVAEFKDYTYNQILQKLQMVQNLHESEYSCFVCCILSYGRMGYLCDSKDVYPAQNIFKGFFGNECKGFAGKPKIFLIQACPCDVDVSSDESTDYGEPNASIFRIPTRSDFLVVYSTIPGNLSWNLNSDKGSWFINALSSTIENHISEMDLLQLLSIVNHKLSELHKSKGFTVEVPCVTSTLIRDIELLVKDSGDSEVLRNKGHLYEMVSNGDLKRGKVLIFNHEFYENKRNDRREGTDNDVKCFSYLFPKPDFKVYHFKDSTKEFIFEKLHKAAKSHKRYSCFICCILTHGNHRTLSAFDQDYEIDEMLSCFHNKWSDKPKVFLLQSCQGKQTDPGCEMAEKLSLADNSDSESDPGCEMAEKLSLTDSSKSETDPGLEEAVSEVSVNFRHLSHPDFLLLTAAPPGYRSFRNKDYGSWFIQELFKVFTSNSKDKDFLQLLTKTNRQVAKCVSKNSKVSAYHDKKQTLCLTSTLTRNLDFKFTKNLN